MQELRDMIQLTKSLRIRLTGQADGFSLVEVLIAMVILSIGLLSIAAMQMSAVKGNSRSNNLTERTTLSSNFIEYLLNLPYTHVDLAETVSAKSRNIDGATYSWEVTNDSPTQKTIRLTITVSNYGQNRSVTLNTIKVRGG